MSLAAQLGRARELAGFTQDDVAAALGVSRAMISYWEGGQRRPSQTQVAALAALYRRQAGEFYSDASLDDAADEARMLFRRATASLSAAARQGIGAFIDFLDNYAALADACQVSLRGMQQSPFGSTPGFDSAEDARRKAEEVRAHLRIGLGPVIDEHRVCELLGITVYYAGLGKDLTRTISGAFYHHPKVGFAILINLEMTPGRRRFTLAHELAHALLDSDHDRLVVSGPKRDPRERFADMFAGEFLMPGEGIRRAVEEIGARPRIDDPADVIHLQRFFNVSYITALVRLRQARLLSAANFEAFQSARPVAFAERLGYEIDEEEYQQDPQRWRLNRFPPRFRRLLRAALRRQVVSVPTAANLTGLSLDEVEELTEDGVSDSQQRRTELHEYEVTGVLAG
jgi:Zn-dependent peptidase ImmA (M78 family)/DNA-binding XRE family transcriptional regulator